MARVLHASYSGYFPYCLQNTSIAIFDYSADISLPLAMATFWRAKRIRWFGNITWPSVGWDNLPWHIEISSSSTNEQGLVCWPNWIVSSVENLNDGGGSPIVIGSQSSWNFEQFYYNENNQNLLVNQSLEVSGFFVAGSILGFSLRAFNINPVFQYYSMPFADAGSLVLAGEFPYSNNEDPSPPNDFTTTLDHSIEYWSYGGTYNTSTGQPL